MSNYQIYTDDVAYDPEEIIEFLSKIFGPNYHDARVVKNALFESEPSIRAKNIISARKTNRELIGLVRIVDRQIYVDGVLLRAGFITSVGVHPEWRNRGIASELICRSIEILGQRDFDLSAVHGRRAVDGFYPKFGYCNVGRYINLEIISAVGTSSDLQIFPYSDEDLGFIMKSYARCYHGLTGSICRSSGVWQFLLKKVETSNGSCRIFLVKDRNGLCGYMVTLGEAMIEAVFKKRILQYVPGLVSKMGIKWLKLHPLHPLFLYCRKKFSTVTSERFALDGGYMARILRPDLFLSKIGQKLATRASNLSPAIQTIRLMGYQVDLGTGEINAHGEVDDIFFEQKEAAVQMLLGFIEPKRIRSAAWMQNFDDAIEFLFPNKFFHTSVWDEV